MLNKSLDQIELLLKPVTLGPLPADPLVSVLTANYNYARYLGEAIESAQAQTYKNVELIVCDDGSKDDSCELVKRYAQHDDRIKLIRKTNGGVSSALNAAYSQSKGHIVCLLDADDRFLPEKLEMVVAAFRSHSESGFLGHRMFLIDSVGRRQGLKPLFANHPSGWYGPFVARYGDYPPGVGFGSGICLRREIADLIFPLPEKFRTGADGAIILLACLMTPIIGIDVPLTDYREHGGNVTNTARVTVESLGRDLHLRKMYCELRTEYLRGVDSRLAEILPEFDQHMGTLVCSYIQTRLQRMGGDLSAYRNLTHSEDFHALNPLLRWFWRCSILLPRRLFGLAVDEVLRPGWVKQLVWRIMKGTPSCTTAQVLRS